MTRHRLYRRPRQVRGFSLIELMISMVIGLVISIAAISAYLGTADASKSSSAQGRMNEDAQAALMILSQQIRMAGNNPFGTTTFTTSPAVTIPSFQIRGCDGTFSNITSSLVSIDGLTCTAGTTTRPDSIAVSYYADKFSTARTASNAASDCLGAGLTNSTATLPGGATSTFAIAENRFYIGTSTAIVTPSLYCKGSATARQQPLVENIENMQLQYGTVPMAYTPTTGGVVAGYLDANEVTSQPVVTNPPWMQVRTVRVCVIVASEDPVAPDVSSAMYTDCNDNLVTNPPDRRLRRAFFTTVVLRNRQP